MQRIPTFTKEEIYSDENILPPSSAEAKEEQEDQSASVSSKAREAGQSFKDLIRSVGKKAKSLTAEKGQQIKEMSVEKDRQEIQTLGETAERLLTVFEITMNKIETEYNFTEQEMLLSGYKKLLEEQVNIIKARLAMVKRINP